MGSSFGDTVASLLSAFADALALLSKFGGSNATEDGAQLRASLRSDRSKVRRLYASRRSRDGRRLEKGDSTARSAVRRVVRRLTAAMSRLVHLAKGGQMPVLDYESLVSLSNTSRIDAVHAIDELSSRVGDNSSRMSLRSGRSQSSRGSRRSYRSHGSHKSHGSHSSYGSHRGHESTRRRSTHHGSQMREPSRRSSHGASKRMSKATMSSGSTKLGEVRGASRRSSLSSRPYSYSASTASDATSLRPTYPLRPFPDEVKGKKRLWGLFRR